MFFTKFKLIAIALGAAAVVSFIALGYKQAYERGRLSYQSEVQQQFNVQLQQAIKDAEKNWAAANKHIETVIETRVQLKEVVKNVKQNVPAYISTCSDLGAEWLRQYNAVITADAENTRQR